MTLDFGTLNRQVAQMGVDLAGAAADDRDRVNSAVEALHRHAQDMAALNARLEGGHFQGLAAGPVEPIDCHRAQPSIPAEYTVVASDGSLIEPDRHGVAYYFVLNIGSVALRYGPSSNAMLESVATLGYRPEDMYLVVGEDEVRLEGGALRVKRAVAEVERLAVLLEQRADERPVLGLLDGTLIPWMPGGHGMDQPALREALLGPLREPLRRLKELAIPIASYVSRPRSSEVVNLLRAGECPYPGLNCRERCPQRGPRHPAPCDKVSGIDTLSGLTDRHIWQAVPLADGERSAVFASRSRDLQQYQPEGVCFCYLNVGTEIARLEMPAWVASDPVQLDFVHGAVYDQCRRAGGYPRALVEAHEKAVIGMGDREQCARLVEMALARNHVPVGPSAKEHSKQHRGI